MVDADEFSAIPITVSQDQLEFDRQVTSKYSNDILNYHQQYRVVIEKVIRQFIQKGQLLEEDAYWEIAGCAAVNIPGGKYFLLIFTGDITLTSSAQSKTQKGKVTLLSNRKKDKNIYIEEEFDNETDLNKIINKCLTFLADRKRDKEFKKQIIEKEKREQWAKLEEDMMRDIYDIPDSIAAAITEFVEKRNRASAVR